MRRIGLLIATLLMCVGCLTPENVHKVTTENACHAIRANITEGQRQLLAEELDRRGIFADRPRSATSTADIIKNRHVWIGMSEEQLLCTLGKPKRINRSVGSWGVHKQWVYGKYGRPLVYTENGFLESWQD